MKRLIIYLIFVLLLFFSSIKDTLAFNDPLSVSNNMYGIGIINFSDLKDASYLVNSTNGDWGYITIVITKEQRNKNTWQNFFDEARRLHIIPIVRVATKFDGKNWEVPILEDIDSWVNFFNSLNWVIENRYVVIGNEPNHSNEWGGKVSPEEYALYLKTFSERLKNSSKDYFVLPAGLDQAAINSKITMDEKMYIQRMFKSIPNIFDYIDGLNSHSYPNPNFSGAETATGRKSTKGYEWELDLIKSFGVTKKLPVFVSETGWLRTPKNEEIITKKFKYAFTSVWSKDPQIVAVTPFILNYTEDPFFEFSWKKKDGSFYEIYNEIRNIEKISGSPIQKIEGEIIINFLNPIGSSNTSRKGYFIARNTGQNIWDNFNINIVNEDKDKIEVTGVNKFYIEPFKSGPIIYTIKFPENINNYDFKLGLFVKDKRIGNIFSGSILSIEPPSEKNSIVFKVFSIVKAKIFNFINLVWPFGSKMIK